MEIDNVFRNIENRNNLLLNKFKEELKIEKVGFDNRFNQKVQKMQKFIQFRNKVDKLESGYYLSFSKEQIIEIKNLTNNTKEQLFSEALKKSNENPEKAISLIFDPSSSISVSA